jgi:hypothetical protein
VKKEEPQFVDFEQAYISLCKSHMLQVIAIHESALRRLIEGNPALSRELAELFEDAANIYLNFSEEIGLMHSVTPESAGTVFLPDQALAGLSDSVPVETTGSLN